MISFGSLHPMFCSYPCAVFIVLFTFRIQNIVFLCFLPWQPSCRHYVTPSSISLICCWLQLIHTGMLSTLTFQPLSNCIMVWHGVRGYLTTAGLPVSPVLEIPQPEIHWCEVRNLGSHENGKWQKITLSPNCWLKNRLTEDPTCGGVPSCMHTTSNRAFCRWNSGIA